MFALIAALFVPTAHASCYVEVTAVSSMTEYDAAHYGWPINIEAWGDDSTCEYTLVVYELPIAPYTGPFGGPPPYYEAHDGTDFEATSITWSKGPGYVSQSINVTVYDDHDSEPDEAFAWYLEAGPEVTIVGSAGDGLTILDDDGGLGVEPADFLVDETGAIDVWDSIADDLRYREERVYEWRASRYFHVYLDQPQETPVSFRYQTDPDTTPWAGTATPSADYETTTGSFTLAPGQVDYYIEVPIVDDGVSESPEAFRLSIFDVDGAPLSDQSSVTTVILDDDCPEAGTCD